MINILPLLSIIFATTDEDIGSGIIELLKPIFGGDAVMAGFFGGTFFILFPIVVVGAVLAAKTGRSSSGTIVMAFSVIGIFLNVLVGLYPLWFLMFILAFITFLVVKKELEGKYG